MLLTSHLFATVLVGKALALNEPELYAALISGVGIDLDHVFVNKKWIRDAKDFITAGKVTRGINQHSWLQEIFFGTIAGSFLGFAVSGTWPMIRWWIVPLFLMVHIAMDAVMNCEHRPFVPFGRWKYYGWLRSGTNVELVLSLVGLAALSLLPS